MCGISGIVAQASFDPQLLAAMSDEIRHRGPDDEGYALWRDGRVTCYGGADTPLAAFGCGTPYAPSAPLRQATERVGLGFGHRRLAIVDLSVSGHQPMSYRDRYWITYNGEVYNHVELRTELEALGYCFVSHTDTEVILAAYDCWGEECLHRFNGMWAFAIFDAQRETLFLARDRFGVKPLYYWASPARFLAFASEIKQFTVLPGWQPRLNRQRCYDFLAWEVLDHTDETFFSGVHQLRQGECCTLYLRGTRVPAPGDRLPVRSWYRFPSEKRAPSLPEAAGEFLHLFEDAVRLRLRVDVPLGSCLSGGLDSSSIVCVMNRILNGQGAGSLQKTFSAASDLKRLDETKWIGEVVRETGVQGHSLTPALDRLLDEVPRLSWHQDEPFGSTSIYAQWSVFGLAARHGVKVMLDGQGADEYLAGYHNFFPPLWAGLLLRGDLPGLAREMLAGRRLHGFSPLQSLCFLGGGILPVALQGPVKRALGLKSGASHDWLDLSRLGVAAENPWRTLVTDSRDVGRFCNSQLTRMSLPMLLHWEDRDSMAHSIESRLPFLDYRLVEFVLGLPDRHKLHQGLTKVVLREAMRGVLPEPVRARTDKIGFATAEEEWLRRSFPMVRSYIEAAIAASGGIVQPAVLDLLDRVREGTKPFDCTFWRIISFGAWLSRFSVTV